MRDMSRFLRRCNTQSENRFPIACCTGRSREIVARGRVAQVALGNPFPDGEMAQVATRWSVQGSVVVQVALWRLRLTVAVAQVLLRCRKDPQCGE